METKSSNQSRFAPAREGQPFSRDYSLFNSAQFKNVLAILPMIMSEAALSREKL